MHVLFLLAAAGAAQSNDSIKDAQALLRTYCTACHQGKAPVAGFNAATLAANAKLTEHSRAWTRAITRVRNGDMPPQGKPAPSLDQREHFAATIEAALRESACAAGPVPGPVPLRRLNRAEYAATVRDLLNIHFNAGHALPADGAGGEGFDNAAETLFLSPVHAEKYLEAAKQALDYGAKDPKSAAAFLKAAPGAETTPNEAARQILDSFLPRAFRRPVSDLEKARYFELYRGSYAKSESFNHAILFALQGVLMSPQFLFRIEEANPSAEARPAPQYALATRLSYFLWGTMPDAALFDLAAQNKLQDPAALTEQVPRMLKDIKAREFAERFVEQWLGTRELGRDIKPDMTLFPAYYDAELQAAIRYEPILFFQEILAENHSLLDLLDANYSVLNNKLAKHYGIVNKALKQQPVKAELPPDSHRGGLLGMTAVLATTSYPQRTSPVLRGKWILDSILGTPPPPPPPNVPALSKEHQPNATTTLRERLTEHRRDPTCQGCHKRMDPLGFALENYNVLGEWRTEDSGKPIDVEGELPDGTKFNGPAELKRTLLSLKDLFIHNLTSKLLGYALGRGLTLEDSCTVDEIVKKVQQENYSAHTLIREIVLSVPFRYQPGGSAPKK